jgi:hypothetical protein
MTNNHTKDIIAIIRMYIANNNLNIILENHETNKN